MQQAVGGGGGLRAFAKIAVRVLALVLCLQIAATSLPGLVPVARADDELMLEEEQKPFTQNGWGWMFLGLSIIAAGVAYNDYQETDYNAHKAQQAYKNYVNATDPTLVTFYRDQTMTYDHRALSYESSSNAASILGVVFLATAIAIWHSSGKEDTPLMLSDRGVQWTYKF